MNAINRMYGNRLITAGTAISKLDGMGISVIAVDLNQTRPVLTVQPCRALKQLSGFAFSKRNTPVGLVQLMQASFANCRIEWEAQS